jgi:hypothetical protein
MARLIVEDSPQFNEKTMQNLISAIPVYNSDEDTFFIRPEVPQPAVSYDLGGELWVRFDPTTKEVIGFEIENFESVFLKNTLRSLKSGKLQNLIAVTKKQGLLMMKFASRF